ncbi:uncharacterized protein LOC132300640 [Cornus florida]|uniref:uncharacterized protein LOC132300640 n=1 Tax=Cornus florida TaxID=4283 RepID=UPI0028A07806|nr:uncharacterized protein LOC132300640 [Cornus florida]
MSNIEGQKRKSARISALETAAHKDQRNRQTGGEASQRNATPASAPPPPFRPTVSAGSGSGGQKEKRLDEVAGSSTAPTTRQDGENPKHEDSHASGAISPSAQQMPGKDKLEFLLDILQRRDTHEIFAQPVDGEEVEGYYDTIKEPMDFGTMRAKLQEGMYTTLEQFEKDVFLISSNAMLFNSSTTIFFRQARAIHELAKRVFHTLKTDPGRIEDEFSHTRKRPGRKPQGEAGPSRTRPANLRRNAQACRGSSSSDPLADQRDNAVLPGSGDGGNVKFCQTERRQTYKSRSSLVTQNEPIISIVYNCSNQLVPGDGGLGYKESLLQFVKHLGPTAQMVAQRKIGSMTEALIYQSQKSSNSVEYKDCLISLTTAQQGPVIENQMPSIFGNRPGHLVIIRDANDRLGIHAATLKGKTVEPSGLMDIHGAAASEHTDIHYAASKGKNVFTGEGMDIFRHPSRGMKAYASDRVNIDRASKGKIVQTCEGMEIHSGTSRDWMAPHGATSKGKNVVIGSSMDIYGGTCGKNLNVARNSGALSRLMVQPGENTSLLLQAAGEDINARIAEPCGKYMTADTKVDSSQLGDQIQPIQWASGSQSGLLEFLSRGYRRPRSLVHPSEVIMPLNSSQTDTLLHALDSHSLSGVEQNNSQLIHNFCSTQVSQAMEWSLPTPWGPQAICDFPDVQQQPVSVPHMQAEEVNPLGNNTFLQQQLALAGNMQPQPNAINLLGQDTFAQGAQLGMVPSMHLQPRHANPLDQDVYVRQDTQLALDQHMQPEHTGMNLLCRNTFLQQGGQFAVPPQGLVFNAGNVHERAPQGHQAGTNAQLLWNFQQQALMDPHHPNLNLQL